MGTDNLFHKRKARTARALQRRAARRAPYAKILIVCEGEKTEPNYFNGVKDHYGLNSANIEICGECGADPLSIFKYAKQRYRVHTWGRPCNYAFLLFSILCHTPLVQKPEKISPLPQRQLALLFLHER